MNTHKYPFRLAFLRSCLPDALAVLCLGIFSYMAYIHYHDLVGIQDIGVYKGIANRADDLFNGIPNAIRAEYPPLATILFWIAKRVQWFDFPSAWIGVATAGCLLTWGYLRLKDKNIALAFALMLPMAELILGHDMVYGRFDMFVALFVILSIVAYEKSHITESALFLMLAACVKIVPLIGFPFLLAAAPRGKRKDVFIGALWAIGVTAFLSVLILGWQGTIDNVVYMVTYHEDRGIQIESTWSSALLLFGISVMKHVPTGLNHLSYVNIGVGSATATFLSKFFVLGGLAGLFLWSVWKKKSSSYGTLVVCALLWSLFATPVLSPQYLVWVIPVVLLALVRTVLAGQNHPAFGVTAVLTIAVAGVTQWIFPYNYSLLIAENGLAVLLLALRNIGLLGLFVAVASFGNLLAPQLVLRSPDDLPSGERGTHFTLDTVLLLVASFLFFFVRPAMIPTVAKVQYMTNGELHSAAAELPVTLPNRDLSEFGVQANIVLTNMTQNRYFRIRQDDCLQHLNVNGHWIDEAHMGFCEGSGPGRVFDLGAYMHPGANTVSAIVRNTGGGIGFDFAPVDSPFLILIVLLFGVTVAWYVFQLLLLLPALRDLAVHCIDRIGYTLQRLWTRSRLRTGTSSTASADQQMPLSI